MGTTQEARVLVKKAFPDHHQAIERAYDEHPSFRELCQDYRQCSLALARWRQDRDPAPMQRSREYAELLDELANEIRTWFDEVPNDPMPTTRVGGP
jgi:hypothetical protein